MTNQARMTNDEKCPRALYPRAAGYCCADVVSLEAQGVKAPRSATERSRCALRQAQDARRRIRTRGLRPSPARPAGPRGLRGRNRAAFRAALGRGAEVVATRLA